MANKIITVDTLTYFKTKLMEKLDVWKNSIESWKAEINIWKSGIDSWKTSIDNWKTTIDTWKTSIDSWKTSISSTVSGHTTSISNLQSSKQDKLIAGENITIAADGKTISATDTKYTDATTSSSGLMSSADKSKLNGIEVRANNYVLPIAEEDELGGLYAKLDGTTLYLSTSSIS